MHCRRDHGSTGATPAKLAVSSLAPKINSDRSTRTSCEVRAAGAKKATHLTWCCLIQCLTGVALCFSFHTIFSGKFILGVKLSNLKALGITMPPTLLISADEVIE